MGLTFNETIRSVWNSFLFVWNAFDWPREEVWQSGCGRYFQSRSTATASWLQYHTAGEREAERLGRGLINHICFEARRKDCLQVCPSSPTAACSTSAPAHTPEGRDAFKRGGWEGAGLSQSPLPMLPVRRFPEGWWCSPQPGLLCRTSKVYLWLLTVGIWVGVFWSINPDTYGRCKT